MELFTGREPFSAVRTRVGDPASPNVDLDPQRGVKDKKYFQSELIYFI